MFSNFAYNCLRDTLTIDVRTKLYRLFSLRFFQGAAMSTFKLTQCKCLKVSHTQKKSNKIKCRFAKRDEKVVSRTRSKELYIYTFIIMPVFYNEALHLHQ